MGIFNKDDKFNKCLLKVSLVEISQELLCALRNDENAIFKVIISNYARQEYNFIIKVIFLHNNLQFINLKSSIHLLNLIVFIVGQIKVFDNNFYIYAKDINYVNTHFSPKPNVSNDIDLNNSSDVANMTHAKLLSIHCDIVRNSKGISDVESSSFMSLSDKSVGILASDNNFSSK
ncbi:hypothetical protein F8M41_014415 [Gigaspora margarita]|uniref:Uncharacterized protein n=1 Tax=Gigaspora margarita TaxID=4874 RepID=A0A8H4ENZ1_GIGMA|nr:hypothetical protein F8M41_014415 [Gigaspora margarita]